MVVSISQTEEVNCNVYHVHLTSLDYITLTANNILLPSSTPEMTVGMKCCAAYEVTTLARQKVVMESNPTYEEIKVLHTH